MVTSIQTHNLAKFETALLVLCNFISKQLKKKNKKHTFNKMCTWKDKITLLMICESKREKQQTSSFMICNFFRAV